ncbi:uncharacterized protein LOC122789920 [Protopterus annectens]|uniref:uncharacterized protein LOC122789920 n=1 Tax=Protopterus annectens TaxID=7888 RepID=UPI001CFA4604|nr:uncharacterized protein LOC122789920 [Protopterus annectens]
MGRKKKKTKYIWLLRFHQSESLRMTSLLGSKELHEKKLSTKEIWPSRCNLVSPIFQLVRPMLLQVFIPVITLLAGVSTGGHPTPARCQSFSRSTATCTHPTGMTSNLLTGGSSSATTTTIITTTSGSSQKIWVAACHTFLYSACSIYTTCIRKSCTGGWYCSTSINSAHGGDTFVIHRKLQTLWGISLTAGCIPALAIWRPYSVDLLSHAQQ